MSNNTRAAVFAALAAASGAIVLATATPANAVDVVGLSSSSGKHAGTGCTYTLTATIGSSHNSSYDYVSFSDDSAHSFHATTASGAAPSIEWTPNTPGVHVLTADGVDSAGQHTQATYTVDVTTGINLGSSCLALPW